MHGVNTVVVFCKNYYLKDGAFCLEKLTAVVKTQLSKENNDEFSIIDARDKNSWYVHI